MKEYWDQSGLFDAVGWEDVGLEGTIFDEHHDFEQMAMAAELEVALEGELTLILADVLLRGSALGPKVSDALHAALVSFKAARSKEQLAQVAVSCRRFLQHLADALYPPTDSIVTGRKMDHASFKNRLWQWAADNLSGTALGVGLANLEDLGARIDRLYELANKGVHGDDIDYTEVRRLLVTLVMVAADLTALTPPPRSARLDVYGDAVDRFARRVAGLES